MSAINQVLVMLAALSGLGLGIGLGFIAPEELIPGRKYLGYLEKSFLFLAFLPAIYLNWAGVAIIYPIALFLILSFFNSRVKVVAVYVVFIFLFYFSMKDNLGMVLQAAGIFLYGLPAGSLFLLESFPATVAKLNKKFKIL